MKEIEAMTENLGLMFLLNSKALPRMHPPEPCFENQRNFVIS